MGVKTLDRKGKVECREENRRTRSWLQSDGCAMKREKHERLGVVETKKACRKRDVGMKSEHRDPRER